MPGEGQLTCAHSGGAGGRAFRVGASGGAVAFTVELMSGCPTLVERLPLLSYRCGNELEVWGYAESFAPIHQVVAKARDGPLIAPWCSRPGGKYARVRSKDSI